MPGKPLLPSDYVHLHNHTQYSLLDGLSKVPALFDHVQKAGMEAVAITDHGTLSGLIEFYKEGKARGVNPILGMEAYVATRKHTDKEAGRDKLYYHLIILAMNNVGYQNLMALSTKANLEGFYYKPRIDHELLEEYNEGLIVLSGCIGGEIGDLLRQDQYDKAKEVAVWYKKVFGDRYYLEVQDHGHPDHPARWDEQVPVTEKTLKLSKELDIPSVVTCDAHYLDHKDQEAHEILLCVQTGSYLTDENRMSLKNFELHLTDPVEVIKRWGKDHPELISNTRKIALRCVVDIELGKILIPKFPVPKNESEKSYLEKSVYSGLAWRYGGVEEADSQKMTPAEARKTLPKEVVERASYELSVINTMGFNGYFLIISDLINASKDKGIVFGPGRGSAAGSIIAYSLKITELDPLEYDLLFERFLNPDRISMPDIDIDIQDSRRNEVIQYCIDKYGTNRVANIVTFGRMAARNAVRDVARVLQVPYADADRLAKMIPPPIQGRHILLSTSLKDDMDLKNEYETSEQSKRVFDLAVQLEGTIRSHGVHAAGVVIAPDDIVKFAPLEMAQKGVVATQYSMNPIEELGLLKMDFLGLSNLTIIKNALRIIKKVHGEDIDINRLPLDDSKTFELLQRGDTTGVFQFESPGMKRYLRELRPTEFDDVIAMGALYRPGPLSAGLTDSFIKRKNGKEETSYAHPLMKPALESTYGVLVYQEQFMQISRDVCGFTGGEADTLRKAIGKKNREMMVKMEKRFEEGAVENGVDRELIQKFWKQLLGFADYCFNKSHSACYGLISYQTAYLKAHYPDAFMAALMTSDFDDTDRLAIEITECKNMGIQVLPPDIIESFLEFAVMPGQKQIRFGLKAIKNVGSGAVEEILRAREINGGFASLEDFASKVSARIVNRKTIESLIKAGAFDRFADRNVLVGNLDALVAYANRLQKEANSGQTDLFGDHEGVIIAPKLVLDTAVEKHNSREQLQWERDLLGLYLSQHPLKAYDDFLTEQSIPLSELKPEHDGKSVIVAGSINELREITTKKGQKMAFIKIADMKGEIELILFPNAYRQTTGIWVRDHVVLVQGKVNAKDRDGNQSDEVKIMVDDAREVTVEQAQAYQAKGKPMKVPKPRKAVTVNSAPPDPKKTAVRLYIRLEDSGNQDLLVSLKETIDVNDGETEVVLVLGPEKSKQVVKLPSRVNCDTAVVEQIRELVGVTNVKLQ
ncbi:MAG: DNA polymerase III subunit alpha [Candidatus Saccharibacteria bacterium]